MTFPRRLTMQVSGEQEWIDLAAQLSSAGLGLDELPSLTLGYKLKAGDPNAIAADRENIERHVYCRAVVQPSRVIQHLVRRKKPRKKKAVVVEADGFVPKKGKDKWYTAEQNLPGAVKLKLHVAEECKVRLSVGSSLSACDSRDFARRFSICA